MGANISKILGGTSPTLPDNPYKYEIGSIGDNAYGYSITGSPYGSLVPDTVDGNDIVQLSVNTSTGKVRFGVLGSEQIPAVDTVSVKVRGIINPILLTWDATESIYLSVNYEAANYIAGNVGNLLDINIILL